MARIDLGKMFEGMRADLERDQAEGKLASLSVADLADAISHPLAPEVIADCMEAEASSVKQGEMAPDFCLPWLPGPNAEEGETMRLSEQLAKRPVALVFGSYT